MNWSHYIVQIFIISNNSVSSREQLFIFGGINFQLRNKFELHEIRWIENFTESRTNIAKFQNQRIWKKQKFSLY